MNASSLALVRTLASGVDPPVTGGAHMSIGMKKSLNLPFDEVLKKLPEALKSEGFGILTEIDVQKTLAQKLQVDFRRYRILGTCNPAFAHQALSAELDVGALLPCNFAVYEEGTGMTNVIAVDPLQTMARDSTKLREIAMQVREKLGRVIERL